MSAVTLDYSPYQPPQAELYVEQKAATKAYDGIGRAAFFFITLAATVLVYTTGALNPTNEVFLAVFIFSIGVRLAAIGFRLKNMGVNPWWTLLAFVPIANVILGFRCLFYPEGYQDTQKLDKTGKNWLVGIVIFLVFIVLVGLGSNL